MTDKQNATLVGARMGSWAVPVYDDGTGPLWISRNSIGINGIVRAASWSDAYEICADEFFPEADETVEQLIAEYGFERDHWKVVKDASVLTAGEHTGVGERFATSADYTDNGRLPSGMFVRWATVETPDPDAWTENELFQEAYGFRPNGPNSRDKRNHGIYAKDLNGDYLEPLTDDLIAELGLELEWEEEDA